MGKARIEFHGDNLAETVEEEREAAAREERQAREVEEEREAAARRRGRPGRLRKRIDAS